MPTPNTNPSPPYNPSTTHPSLQPPIQFTSPPSNLPQKDPSSNPQSPPKGPSLALSDATSYLTESSFPYTDSNYSTLLGSSISGPPRKKSKNDDSSSPPRFDDNKSANDPTSYRSTATPESDGVHVNHYESDPTKEKVEEMRRLGHKNYGKDIMPNKQTKYKRIEGDGGMTISGLLGVPALALPDSIKRDVEKQKEKER